MDLKYKSWMIFTCLAFALGSCSEEEKAESKPPLRPNIIFIINDDHAAQAISYY